ncbi:MAG TPA: polysaccharide deacetylase family protein [Acidimicrobiia bacterium]
MSDVSNPAAPSAPIPILLYHSVRDEPLADMARWTVSPATFDDQIRRIVDAGRTAVTVSELAAALRGERMLPDRPLVVTFDDGFLDTLGAVDALLAASIPATVYVTAAYLAQPGMMQPDDVTRLGASPGVELGAHGMTHRRLDELTTEHVRRELVGSQRLVADLTQRPCQTFAYPHGSHDRRTLEVARESGYASAVAVKNALSHVLDDPFALARVTVERGSGTATVERALDGTLPVVRPGERARTRAYRTVRRLARCATLRAAS